MARLHHRCDEEGNMGFEEGRGIERDVTKWWFVFSPTTTMGLEAGGWFPSMGRVHAARLGQLDPMDAKTGALSATSSGVLSSLIWPLQRPRANGLPEAVPKWSLRSRPLVADSRGPGRLDQSQVLFRTHRRCSIPLLYLVYSRQLIAKFAAALPIGAASSRGER